MTQSELRAVRITPAGPHKRKRRRPRSGANAHVDLRLDLARRAPRVLGAGRGRISKPRGRRGEEAMAARRAPPGRCRASRAQSAWCLSDAPRKALLSKANEAREAQRQPVNSCATTMASRQQSSAPRHRRARRSSIGHVRNERPQWHMGLEEAEAVRAQRIEQIDRGCQKIGSQKAYGCEPPPNEAPGERSR